MKALESVDACAVPRFATTSEASGTDASIAIPATPDEFWVIDWITASYADVPTDGVLTVSVGPDIVWQVDIAAGGPCHIEFNKPLYLPTKGVGVLIELADGGAAKSINVRYR